jgi:Xaa-Pro aminopeptidase
MRMKDAALDVFWVTSLVNIRYLTGFTGSSAQLLVNEEEAIFITDGRYQEQVGREVEGCRIEIHQQGPWHAVFEQEQAEAGWKKAGYEAGHLSCEAFEKVKALPALHGAIEWESTSGWIEKQRLIKDEEEVSLLRESSAMVDRVFESLLPEFREGVTEKEILRKMINLLWENGAEDPSFDPIVLFGPRSSLPHGQPSDRPLEKNEWVLLDFGAIHRGYCSDCTRTFIFGEPTGLQRERHAAVLSAHDTAIAAAQPGVPCKEVDAEARRVLREAGIEEYFIHGLGHGVGLEIHEGPRLAATSLERLEEGMVVTIEPGIYIPGWGGIRIEDAVVVRAGGGEVLTACDRSIDPDL